MGDPYEEKRLIEACLELLDAKLVVGIQDLGGAGLVCATSETAARGGVGMDVDVSAVPRREPGMAPYEVMTSESQERMLAIVTPEDLSRVEEVCRRWEVRTAVVGRVTEPPPGQPGRLRVLDGFDGELLGDVPAVALSEEAPLYHRPMTEPGGYPARAGDDPGSLPAPADCGTDVCAMVSDPSWVYRQYDHQLFLNTVAGPGGDAAVLRLAAPGLPRSERGLALTTDSNPTWCAIDPRAGTAATVAEGALNVACAGARPVAVVNCLNFGNPEHPEVMWQLSEAVDGMSEACTALGLPVIGGNVSLYNESGGADIDPTPVIGTLGLIERLAAPPPGVTLVEGASLVLLDASVGATTDRRSPPSLAGSRWAVERRGHRNGHPARARPARSRPPGGVRGRPGGRAGGQAGRGPSRPPGGGHPRRVGRWSGRGAGRARGPLGYRHGGVRHRRPPRAVHRGPVPGGGVHHPPHRADLAGGRGRGRVPGARLDRRRPGGGGRAGRPRRGGGHRRVARAAAVPAGRAGPAYRDPAGLIGWRHSVIVPAQVDGRRDSRRRRTRSGTLRSPRPVPTDRSGLSRPW